MKSTTMLALAGAAAAADYADFDIPWLKAHQPNGQKFDYYDLEFNVSSSNGDSPTSAYCHSWWSDSSETWSDSVPAIDWIPCTVEEGSEELSEFSFHLFPYYSIGNFTLALRQNFTHTIDDKPTQIIAKTSFDDPFRVSNTSSTLAYNCTINPFQNPWGIHAGGDCETTPGSSGFSLPIDSAEPACEHASKVSLSFPVEIATQYGESVYVVGSIPELGSWDLSRAVPLNANGYTSEKNIWNGGDVEVAAGTEFEWKPVKKNSDGSWHWSCNDNIAATVDRYTCGKQVIAPEPGRIDLAIVERRPTVFGCPN